MEHDPTSPHLGWLAAGALLLLLAGCGGGSSVSVGEPSSNIGPVIAGTVSMPNGQLAAAPSALARLAQAVVARVEALVAGNVAPVGEGVAVRLIQIDEENIVNGQIRNGRVRFTAMTNSDGVYALRLPTGTNANTCRFYVEVGSSGDRTLTRAFVYAENPGEVDIDFQSEATVRLLLDQIEAGATSLCSWSAAEVKLVNDAVVASSGQVFGDTAAAVNSAAVVVAGADPDVQNAIAIAIGAITPAATATNTSVPLGTATATGTVAPPTPTIGPPTATRTRPTRTQTRVATRTPTPDGSAANRAAVVPTPTPTPTVRAVTDTTTTR